MTLTLRTSPVTRKGFFGDLVDDCGNEIARTGFCKTQEEVEDILRLAGEEYLRTRFGARKYVGEIVESK